MEKSWLWDVRKSEKQVREILKNPLHKQFIHYAALLLSRSNEPGEVFEHYFDKETFVRYWDLINRRMRKNKWDRDRISFWREIFRHLSKQFKTKGIQTRHLKVEPPVSLCKVVGLSIKKLRISSGMTQQKLAQKAGLHQQVISKIEKGTANPSLKTIEKITKHLMGGAGIRIVHDSSYITTTYQGLGKHK